MKTMTIKRPRTKPAEIRREELIDAAEALFLERGFSATSVGEIVERAEVAKGTFYLYFDTKDDVFAALQERFVGGMCAKVGEALARDHACWPDRLDAWVEACVDAYLDQVALHDLVFHRHQQLSRAKIADNPLIGRFSELLQGGVEDGAWAVNDLRQTAVMLFNALHGAVDDILATGQGQPVERLKLVRSVTAFCRSAMRIPAK